MNYPEHEKLKAIVDKSQVIGEFVDWLSDKGIHLAQWGTHELFSCNTPIRDLLAEFFSIDQNKLDAEKDAMLEDQRKLNAR